MKKKFLLRFSYIFVSIFLGTLNVAEGQQEEKESFYSKSNRLILRLEHSERTSVQGSENFIERSRPDGTAFFVQWNDELYVVTARHVAEKRYDLRAKVWSKLIDSGEVKMIFLHLPKNRWVYHPNQGDAETRGVEVAAMKITWLPGHQVMTFLYEADGQKEGKGNQLSFQDPEPPQPVLVFGFPSEIGFELTEQKPLGRMGIISMVAGKKFIKMEGKFLEERACLIDLPAFPGNSGSPVINQFDPTAPSPVKLLGVLFGTNPKRHYAVIEPVSRIRETLEMAKRQSLERLSFWSFTGSHPDKP